MTMMQQGSKQAPILIILDTPSEKCVQQKRAMTYEHLEYFASVAQDYGFGPDDFAFLNCGPFVPADIFVSKRNTSKFLKDHRDSFLQAQTKYHPEIIVTMGVTAASQVSGRTVQITKVRGQVSTNLNTEVPVFHMYGVGHVLRSPDLQNVFEADFRKLAQLRDRNWEVSSMLEDAESTFDYQWCTDLTDWLKDPPQAVAYDTEGTGLDWFRPEVFPFTLQLCREPGSAIMIPLIETYYPELERDHTKLMKQVKQFLEDEKIRKAGHNKKYDYHMLKKHDITVEGWAIDTQQAIHAINENLRNKSLDECVRLFVPEMAGYADAFNLETDKSQMIHVPKDKILKYGCGDADAVFRLAKYCKKELLKDRKQYFLFEQVQMPALRAFADTLEYNGINISEEKLQELVESLELIETQKYDQLIKYVPGAVKKKHLDEGKALKFSRSDFVVDILFTKEGFNLKPIVFTKETAKLKDITKRIPSTSATNHLSYFKDFIPKLGKGKVAEEINEETGNIEPFPYIKKLIDYKQLTKMRTTYVGYPASIIIKKGVETVQPPSGFWQYIYDGKIHPSYDLSVTVTGRSNSRNPNGQNLPKRGKYAKMYRKIFFAPEGYTLVQVDYSQAELRIAGWQANEPAMIEAYANGLDLHAITAASGMQMEYDEFMSLSEDQIELGRYTAKARNFGLIYGMSAAGYMDYAYTGYGLVLTLEQAERDREAFFDTYKRLPKWHKETIQFAHEHGYVRALHGAKRKLPDLYSPDRGLASAAERQSINSPVQRFASDLGVMAETRLTRDLKLLDSNDRPPIFPLMFIHDALVILVKNDYLEEALPAIKFYMESNPLKEWFNIESPVPIIADVEIGPNLAALSKRKNIVAQAPCWYSGQEPLVSRFHYANSI